MKITAEMVMGKIDNYLDEWVIGVRNGHSHTVDPDGKSLRVLVPQGAEFSGDEKESDLGNTLDLSGLDLKGKDLHFTLFKDVNMKGIDFTDCDLRFSQFISCDLRHTIFDNCDLSWAQIRDCNLLDSSFFNTDCYDITFVENETKAGVTGRNYIPQEQHPLKESVNFFDRPSPGKKTGKKINPFQLPGDNRPPHTAAYAFHQEYVREKYNLEGFVLW